MSTSNSSLRIIGEIAMGLLGVDNIALYIAQGAFSEVYLENTQPPSLIMGEQLLKVCTEPELLFILSKVLFYAGQNLVLPYKLDQDKMSRYVSLLAKSFLEQQTPLPPEEDADIKRIKGGLPRKLRKSLEERKGIWEKILNADIQGFQKKLRHAANCCGLLASNSISAASQALLRLRGEDTIDLTPPETRERISKQDEIKELFRFVLSPDHDELVKKFGGNE